MRIELSSVLIFENTVFVSIFNIEIRTKKWKNSIYSVVFFLGFTLTFLMVK